MEAYNLINEALDEDSKKLLTKEYPVFGTNEQSFHRTLATNRFHIKFLLSVLGHLEKSMKIRDIKSIYTFFLNDEETRKASLATSYFYFCTRHLNIEDTKLAFQQAITLTSRIGIHDDFAKYLIQKNYLKEAEKIYLNVKRDEYSTRIYIGLADIYRKTNRYDSAIELYKVITNKYENNAVAWKLLRETESLKRDILDNKNSIMKSISFKSEYFKAGITILQNFGTLLNDKYPDGGIAFSIKQDGLKITMVIEHPKGEKETVEDYLNRYGLVVTGKLPPEEFSSDPIMVLDLKRQLIQVESDLKWSNEKQLLLTNTINGQDRQIENLSNQLKYFQKQLSDVLSNTHLEVNGLLELLNRGDNQTESLIQPLINSINNENIQETQSTLEHIKKNDSSLFQKLNDLVLNTMSSAGANAPAWVDYLSKILP